MSTVWCNVVSVLIIAIGNIITYLVNENSILRRRKSNSEPRTVKSRLFGLSNRVSTASTATATTKQPQPAPADFWALSLLNPTHLVTPSFSSSSSWALLLLLVLRVSALIYYITSMILLGPSLFELLNSEWLTYFTNWSFTMFGATALVSTAHTVYAMYTRRKEAVHGGIAFKDRGLIVKQQGTTTNNNGTAGTTSSTMHETSNDITTINSTTINNDGSSSINTTTPSSTSTTTILYKWRWWEMLHQFLFTITAPAELFLTVYYWVALQNSDELGSSILVHGTNNIFLLVDVLLARNPFATYQILALTLYVSLYAVVMWIYGSVGGTWPYEDLNWNETSALFWYFAMFLLVVLFYYVYFGLACAREAVIRRSVARKEQEVSGGGSSKESTVLMMESGINSINGVAGSSSGKQQIELASLEI